MKYMNAILTLWCIALTVTLVARPPSEPTTTRDAHFAELTVERLSIVEPSGTKRMVLTNQERMPEPVVDGKTYKRAIRTAGIILYDEDGNETGGLVPGSRQPDGSRSTGFILDHQRSEAAGFARFRRPGQPPEAFLFVNDAKLEGDEEAFENINRVRIGTENRTSSIELKDTSGRPRIRLSVDAKDEPSIVVLDEAGSVTARFPAAMR